MISNNQTVDNQLEAFDVCKLLELNGLNVKKIFRI